VDEDRCGAYVGTGTVAYPCSRPKHPNFGPHMAVENAKSVRDYEAWERAQETLAQFQGPARTTAQSLTSNPAPLPGTVFPREDAAEEVSPATEPEAVVSANSTKPIPRHSVAPSFSLNDRLAAAVQEDALRLRGRIEAALRDPRWPTLSQDEQVAFLFAALDG